MNADWIVEGRLLAMAAPWPEDLPRLPKLGVAGVISLTRSVPEGLSESGLQILHLPVVDFHPPTIEQLREASAFIDAINADGHAVAVHCAAGRGRTGTVCAAWVTTQERSAAQAIAFVRRRRPGAVETREQEAIVARFAALAAGGGSS